MKQADLEDRWLGDAEENGVNHLRLAALLARARKEVDDGLLPAAQVALARNGKLVLFETIGDADNDSLFCVFSATKAITSAAAWILMQEGKLDEDELVVDIIPEFATNHKHDITVQQLFVHTAGFPSAPFKPLDWNDHALRVERFAQWQLNWPPGSRYEYHPTSSMWVIAEIIERRADTTYQQFVRERIAQPLGLPELYVGLPSAENDRVVPNVHVGDPLTTEDYERLGIPEPPVTEVTEEAILKFNQPDVRSVGVPGGGGIMSAADLALFYQGLLRGGLGEEIWSAATLADARRVRSGELRDPVMGNRANRALGIVIAGDSQRNFRGFGKTNSPEAFGHNGAGGQLAWADPTTGLSLAYCTSGHDRNRIRQGRRGVAISSLAAVCCDD
ncbi:MAG: serine hydrolase [Pseudomonadales bacterium]|nr:beta-lactamase family protein [Pseudomonadales bacterium]NIX07992.1 serine hydrolase [Pseudomonadales bacterium]